MAKNSKKTVSASALIGVASHSYSAATATDALVKAVRSAGFQQDSVRNAFIAGQIMLKQQVNSFTEAGYDRALALVTTKAHDVKNPAKPDTRTKQQELWYVAAKVKWSRFLKDNGFQSTGKNAGNKSAKGAVRQVKGSAPAPSPAAAGGASQLIVGGGKDVKVPKMDKLGATSHVQLQASSLLQFSNKNAKLLPAAFKTAIAAFKLAIDKATNEDKGIGPNF